MVRWVLDKRLHLRTLCMDSKLTCMTLGRFFTGSTGNPCTVRPDLSVLQPGHSSICKIHGVQRSIYQITKEETDHREDLYVMFCAVVRDDDSSGKVEVDRGSIPRSLHKRHPLLERVQKFHWSIIRSSKCRKSTEKNFDGKRRSRHRQQWLETRCKA